MEKILTDERIIELFGSKNNYIEQFKWIDNKCNADDFMDVKEKMEKRHVPNSNEAKE